MKSFPKILMLALIAGLLPAFAVAQTAPPKLELMDSVLKTDQISQFSSCLLAFAGEFSTYSELSVGAVEEMAKTCAGPADTIPGTIMPTTPPTVTPGHNFPGITRPPADTRWICSAATDGFNQPISGTRPICAAPTYDANSQPARECRQCTAFCSNGGPPPNTREQRQTFCSTVAFVPPSTPPDVNGSYICGSAQVESGSLNCGPATPSPLPAPDGQSQCRICYARCDVDDSIGNNGLPNNRFEWHERTQCW